MLLLHSFLSLLVLVMSLLNHAMIVHSYSSTSYTLLLMVLVQLGVLHHERVLVYGSFVVLGHDSSAHGFIRDIEMLAFQETIELVSKKSIGNRVRVECSLSYLLSFSRDFTYLEESSQLSNTFRYSYKIYVDWGFKFGYLSQSFVLSLQSAIVLS